MHEIAPYLLILAPLFLVYVWLAAKSYTFHQRYSREADAALARWNATTAELAEIGAHIASAIPTPGLMLRVSWCWQCNRLWAGHPEYKVWYPLGVEEWDHGAAAMGIDPAYHALRPLTGRSIITKRTTALCPVCAAVDAAVLQGGGADKEEEAQ